ncbi:MAG: anion permease [Armatimonadetes bacterium]|jgi:PiT family inorganic phosphate transporter|nr:anion permease [Armatimonadota bacterium]
MSPLLLLVILVVVLALAFDYSNGFHDAANSIATVVATRVLRPYQAVAWAAFFNFVAAFTMHTDVAATVGKGTIHQEIVDVYIILSCLVGAIGWNVTTWYLGLPSSSSHALIGGLVGAALVKVGPSGIVAPGLTKTALFIVLSPTIGMVLALLISTAVTWLIQTAHQYASAPGDRSAPVGRTLALAFSAPGNVRRWSRILQLFSAGFYSFSHGMNDAQKTMGIIAVLLVSMKSTVPELASLPDWIMPKDDLHQMPWVIILSAHAAIALGTLSGGWKIVRTMGMRITELDPLRGFCAETAGAMTVIGASLGGIPVSTTHTITGAIVGVGASRRMSAVRWGVAGTIVWAWILTIPAAGILSALTYVIAARLWPILPTVGQWGLGLVISALLGYAAFSWLRASRSGALAHA